MSSNSYRKDHEAKLAAIQEGSRPRKPSKKVLESETSTKETNTNKAVRTNHRPTVQKRKDPTSNSKASVIENPSIKKNKHGDKTDAADVILSPRPGPERLVASNINAPEAAGVMIAATAKAAETYVPPTDTNSTEPPATAPASDLATNVPPTDTNNNGPPTTALASDVATNVTSTDTNNTEPPTTAPPPM
jgi:hypothetical protein